MSSGLKKKKKKKKEKKVDGFLKPEQAFPQRGSSHPEESREFRLRLLALLIRCVVP